jgi:hypothetical protein
MAESNARGDSPVKRGTVTVLLPVAGSGGLSVPSYARSVPKLRDFPFFCLHMLIRVPVAAILRWLCHLPPAKPARYVGPRYGGPKYGGPGNRGEVQK